MDKRKEADKLYKEAVKLTTPSLLSFRMRGEWEQATPLLERAAMLYKQCGDLGRAKECWERAGVGQERQKSGWHAAKNMEKAGEAAKELGIWADVEAHYGRAAELYAEEGRLSAAAEAAARGARALEERQPEKAQEMYLRAVEWLEDAGKDALAGDIFRQAVAQLVRAGKWADAASMLLRFAVSCDGMGARNSQCKAYLGAVVVWLFAGKAKDAWATYQDALGVDAFMSSDEAFAADALFDAYRSGDSAAIQATVKRSAVFSNLDNQVARLARKLPQGELGVQAAQLGGSSSAAAVPVHEDGEEDLT
ncbi:hypothetical protein D9Q98_007408 [Chlorella vulgaris]|uniref:Gamma-soluble NSF attachment protein n=1 Tax=Chlorella vulgaris TaxID=3077 RepID=A0A9D4TL50_CHLVU|nr:hypothetical protein D9Q98_007408 [Chlorella vulgaris]